MTKEDYENYITHDLDFKYFRATQRFYTFDSFFADTAKGMTGRSGDCGEYVVGSGGSSSGGTSSNTGGGVTEPGETFISTFDGAIVTSDFGLRQNTNQSNYDYVVTINTSNGSSETTTTGYSATVTTAATNSSGYTTIQTSGINWVNFTITYNDTNSSGGSSGSSGPCIKTFGSGDDIIWYWYDECPPSTQLKRGDTGRSTTSFSDCFVVSGGIAVNVTLLAVEVNTMLGSIELNDDELAFLTKNHDATLQIFKFLRTNNSFEDRVFVKLAVEFLRNNPNINFKQYENWFASDYPDLVPIPFEIIPENITYDSPIIQQALPSFNDFLLNFPKKGNSGNYSQMSTSEVYNLVGGSLLNSHLSNPSAYSNACSIRGSRALLYSGIDIPVLIYPNVGQRTQKGGDNRNYILDAVSFNKFMIDKFGDATYTLEDTDANDISKVADLLNGKNGIYVIINKSHQQAGYSGHVDTIINGFCISNAYVNPSGGVKSIRIWELNN